MSNNETERKDAVAEGPGRTLAAAREARGLSVADVAMRMRFAPRQIEALEAEEFHQLPGIAIVRGMVRAYARLVDVDADPLIADLDRRLKSGPMTVHPADMHVPIRESRKEGRTLVVLSLIVVVAVGAFALEWYVRDRRNANVPAVPAAATHEPASGSVEEPVVHTVAVQPAAVHQVVPTREPASAPAEPPAVVHEVGEHSAPQTEPVDPTVQQDKALQMRFTDDVWVEVKDARGRVLVSRVAAAGSLLALNGDAPLAVVLGNADGVAVRYAGKAIDLAPYARTGVARLTLE